MNVNYLQLIGDSRPPGMREDGSIDYQINAAAAWQRLSELNTKHEELLRFMQTVIDMARLWSWPGGIKKLDKKA